jgi:hypothetical protein
VTGQNFVQPGSPRPGRPDMNETWQSQDLSAGHHVATIKQSESTQHSGFEVKE